MRARTALLLAVASLVAAATFAAAGTRGNPETLDPRDDALDPTTGRAAAAPELDLLAVWIEESPSTLTVGVRVRDLGGSPVPQGVVQAWFVSFETGGRTWVADIQRDRLATVATLHPGGASTWSGAPSTSAQTAEVAVRPDVDTVTATFPRTFDLTIDGQAVRVAWSDGTALRNVRAESAQGQGTAGACLCAAVDDTPPGAARVLGEARTQNVHVHVRPEAAAVGGSRGAHVDVPLLLEPDAALLQGSGSARTGPEMTVPLRASLDREGWSVSLCEPGADGCLLTGEVPASGSGRAVYRVHIPTASKPGDVALLTVHGGRFPVAVPVAVGDERPAAALLAPIDPAPVLEPVARGWTLHLQGSTQSDASASARPVFPGRLVPAVPTGRANDTVSVDFAGGAETVALGAWRSEPLAAPTAVQGAVRVELWADWTDATGMRLVGLVGPDPLPLDWDGGDAPHGAVKLAPDNLPSVAASGRPVALVASGDATGLPLARGDRLAVALYLQKTGGAGGANARLFGQDVPSRVSLSIEEPPLPSPIPSALAAPNYAAFRAGFESPAGLGLLRGLSARVVDEDGVARPLLVTGVPQDVRVANGSDPARFQRNDDIARTDLGRGEAVPFTLEAGVVAADVVLLGAQGPDAFNDNDFDLEVWKLDAGARTFVKAARGDGPRETVRLTETEIARHGTGAYEAVVVLDRVAPTAGPAVSYTLEVRSTRTLVVEDAWVAVAALWNFTGAASDDHTFELRLDDGRGEPRVRTQPYRLTGAGPTLPPVADFSFAPDRVVSGEPVNFTDRSVDPDGRIVDWFWDFGDGGTSRDPNPTHVFGRPGAYLVTLQVTDDLGAAGIAAEATVAVSNAPPVPSFVADPTVGIAGRPVRFVDRSADVDGDIVSWAWDFGDGAVSGERSPTHVYDRPGTYNVTLTVLDDPPALFAGATLTRAFVVVAPGEARDGRPSAEFEPPFNPVAGRPARFVDRSVWGAGDLERRWDFGDGNVSTERSPEHTFAAAGSYRVTLRVFPPGREDLNASVTRVVQVSAGGAYAPTFTVAPAAPTTGARVEFADATVGLPADAARIWDFGDGASARGVRVAHTYARPGTYEVTLSVVGPDGEASVARELVVARGAAPSPPAPAQPSGGTLRHYAALYDARVEHLEDYPAPWREAELAGALDGEYLASGTRPAYVHGTVPAQPSVARASGGGVVATNPLGAATRILAADVAVETGAAEVRAPRPTAAWLGSRPVDLSALAVTAPDRDDLEDGLLLVESAVEGAGLRVARSVSMLEGTLHTDVRTVMRAGADQPMRLVTEVHLPAPAGGWLATPGENAVRVVPVAGADNLTLDLAGLPNRWFAVFAEDSADVAGVVLAGDVTGVHVFRDGDDIVLKVEHVGLGQVVAAEYLLVYTVADPDATRYAGVLELARQDAEEVGVAWLGDERAAAVAWATSGATIGIDAARGAAAWREALGGYARAWTLTVDADVDGPLGLRMILPAALLRDGLELRVDGALLAPLDYEALADDHTAVVVVPFEHFSLKRVSVRAVEPGVPSAFLWIAVGLAVVVGVETAVLVRRRRRGWPTPPAAGPRPLDLEPEEPRGPPPETDADRAVKDALLRKLKGP